MLLREAVDGLLAWGTGGVLVEASLVLVVLESDRRRRCEGGDCGTESPPEVVLGCRPLGPSEYAAPEV